MKNNNLYIALWGCLIISHINDNPMWVWGAGISLVCYIIQIIQEG